MKRYLGVLIAIISIIQLNAQKKVYTQKEIDSFRIFPTNRQNILEYKNMLETDANLIGWTYYYTKISMLHLRESTYDSCYYYSNKAIESYELADIKVAHEEEKLITAYYNGGRSLRLYYGDYNKAVKYLHNSLDLLDKYPLSADQMIRGYILKDIASNHYAMGDEKLTLKYLFETEKDANYLKNPLNYGPLYNMIGELYLNKNKTDSAKYFFKKAMLDTIPNSKVSAHNNLGELFKNQNSLDSALYHFRASKEITDAYYDRIEIITRFLSLANYNYILINNKKYKESIKNLEALIDSTKTFDKIDRYIKNLRMITSNYLIDAYQKNNQLDKALVISEQKNEFLEKYHQQVLDEKLRELNIAFEVKEKEESIEQLEVTTEEQSVTIKQRNFITIALGGLILALSGIGFLVFRQRKLKNKYETANLEQRLLRSQLNPHFVFNALNTVSGLANKKSESTGTYIAKLSSLIRLILKNSREEFVSLNDELKSIENYLELQSNFSQKFNYQIVVEDGIDLEETYIPPMFIQPFIENSIEHGLRGVHDGNINVDLKINKIDKLLECKIIDNGIGVTMVSALKRKNGVEYESFSGEILKERLQIYSRSLNKKAKYTIKPLSKEKGTEVNISLPYIFDS